MIKCVQINYQKTTLIRHGRHRDHTNAVNVPELRRNFTTSVRKESSDKDKAVEILFRALKWLLNEDLPLSKFHFSLMNDFNVKDIQILIKNKVNDQSPESLHDFLDCLAEDSWNKVPKKLQKSEYATVLRKYRQQLSATQVIYTQVLNDNFMPETLFISNVECTDTTGARIAKTILNKMSKKALKLGKNHVLRCV